MKKLVYISKPDYSYEEPRNKPGVILYSNI